jgi:nucleoside-diphosphate-sugar epimerase
VSGVLVTGATGFIGQHIVNSLLAQGHTVTALIRPGKKSDPRLPAACIQIAAGIDDVKMLKTILESCSAVVYCAGSVRGGHFKDFQTANVDGIRTLLEAIDQTGRPLPLLLISSLAASRPELSDYSLSKFEGEQCLNSKPNVPWTILRPPAIYGPGDKEMLPILKLIAKGWLLQVGPAEQRVSLLRVEDLAGAVSAWLANPEPCLHQSYSIDDGTANGYSWPDMAAAAGVQRYRRVRLPLWLLKAAARANVGFAKLFGYSPMFTPGKLRELTQQEWLAEDNVRFEAATQWQPRFDLKTGLQDLLPSKGG